MSVEVGIALALTVIAIVTAVMFYRKEKSRSVDSDTLMKSAKQTIDEQKKMLDKIEPIIQKQGEIIYKQEEKIRIQYENDIGELRSLFSDIQMDLRSAECVFKEMRDITEAVKILKAQNVGTVQYISYLESIVKRLDKHWTLKDMQKLSDARAGVNIFLKSMEKINERNYIDTKDMLPLDKYIDRIDDLLEYLPNTRPMA